MTLTKVTIKDEHVPYLEASARLRGVSVTALTSMIMYHVLNDQMILNIMDDDSKPASKPKGSGNHHGAPPADNLFDAVS